MASSSPLLLAPETDVSKGLAQINDLMKQAPRSHRSPSLHNTTPSRQSGAKSPSSSPAKSTIISEHLQENNQEVVHSIRSTSPNHNHPEDPVDNNPSQPHSLIMSKPVSAAKPSAPPSARQKMQLLKQIMVFRKILALNDGRDKMLKIPQYVAKLLLWCILVSKSPLQEKAKTLASQFSLTRKIVRLGHWLEAVQSLLDWKEECGGFKQVLSDPAIASTERTVRLLAPLNASIGIVNDLSDDIICLGKMSMLDSSWVKWATPISDRLWYASIFLDVHENTHNLRKLELQFQRLHKEIHERKSSQLEVDASLMKEYTKIKEKLFLQRISLIKLGADFIFCTIDVFEMGDRVSDGWQACTGLLGAVLGTWKLYIKNK